MVGERFVKILSAGGAAPHSDLEEAKKAKLGDKKQNPHTGFKLVGGIITKTSKSLSIPRLENIPHQPSLLGLFLVFFKSFLKGFLRRLVLSLSLSLALH